MNAAWVGGWPCASAMKFVRGGVAVLPRVARVARCEFAASLSTSVDTIQTVTGDVVGRAVHHAQRAARVYIMESPCYLSTWARHHARPPAAAVCPPAHAPARCMACAPSSPTQRKERGAQNAVVQTPVATVRHAAAYLPSRPARTTACGDNRYHAWLPANTKKQTKTAQHVALTRGPTDAERLNRVPHYRPPPTAAAPSRTCSGAPPHRRAS